MLMILLVTDDRKGSGGIKKLLTFKSRKACQTIGVGFNFFHTFPAAQLKITIEIFFIVWSFLSPFCQFTIFADPGRADVGSGNGWEFLE